jgi:hypothetical protein
VYLGCLAQVLNDLTGDSRRRWTHLFRYTRSVGWSAAAIVSGLVAAVPLVGEYWRLNLALPHPVTYQSPLAVVGLFFIIAGFMNFGFTLVLHAATRE